MSSWHLKHFERRQSSRNCYFNVSSYFNLNLLKRKVKNKPLSPDLTPWELCSFSCLALEEGGAFMLSPCPHTDSGTETQSCSFQVKAKYLFLFLHLQLLLTVPSYPEFKPHTKTKHKNVNIKEPTTLANSFLSWVFYSSFSLPMVSPERLWKWNSYFLFSRGCRSQYCPFS